jgi:phosphatidylglycerophosphate synthase
LIRFREVLERSRRHNQEEEYRVYPVVSRVGKLFTWVLVNLGVSANQTTFLFFMVAVASAGFFAIGEPWTAVVAAILYWLQVVLDFSDGDIARFHQRFAPNGEYWDHLVHMFAEPLVVAGVVLGEVRHGAPTSVIAAGLLLVVAGAFNIALTDVAHLANPPEGAEDEPEPEDSDRSGLVGRVMSLGVRIVGIEPFVLAYTVTFVVLDNPVWHQLIIVGAAAALVVASIYKAWMAHRTGRLPGRAALTR